MITSLLEPKNFDMIEHHYRKNRIIIFQHFIHSCYYVDAIVSEFVDISKMAYSIDLDDESALFDYSQMQLFTDDIFGFRQIWWEPHLTLSDLWIKIPCTYNTSHRGVNCRVVDHLMGIGDCIDCIKNAEGVLHPTE